MDLLYAQLRARVEYADVFANRDGHKKVVFLVHHEVRNG